jgi:uncharacterized protein DUF4340
VNRSQIRMLSLAAVLLLLVFVFANPFKDSLKRDKREWATVFDAKKVAGADRIDIVTASDSTVVVREDGNWVVATKANFPADTMAVGNLLRSVQNAKSAGVASSNPENRAKFQVDTTGVRVKVTAQNAVVAQFTLGKMGADFTTSYVLPAGSNEVLVIRGMNRNIFARPQGMRDRTIFKFAPATLKEVVAETADGGWELIRTDSTWSARKRGEEGIHPADKTVANALVQSLSDFSADSFLDGPTDTVDTGLAAPAQRFTVRFMDGTEATVAVGKKNDRSQYYVSRPDRKAVYLMSEWRFGNISKTVEELEGQKPPTPPSTAVPGKTVKTAVTKPATKTAAKPAPKTTTPAAPKTAAPTATPPKKNP